MRPLLLVALLSLVVAPAAVAAPAGASAAPAVQTDTNLSGTVSYLNGSAIADATVIVGSEARLGNASESELRALAADPPDDVATATTNASGGYEMTVADDVDAELVVAVAEDGVSRLRSYVAGEMDLTVRTTATLTLESPSLTAEPGERVHVPFSLTNTGDQPVEGLSLSVTLPDGWNHVSATSETGTYHQSNRTFTWGPIEPGETVEASFRIFVGLDAVNDSAETYELATFADSRTHPSTYRTRRSPSGTRPRARTPMCPGSACRRRSVPSPSSRVRPRSPDGTDRSGD
ncbi:NPCBM-associated, NEW3 domain of alpha-galactosidase [Halolamina pelagica]|uniref:NPCBM-associated, NEW3 domain of alpha-galactosidase n=1 Tax=Halolamina pelagica TaxID=699431 RepID=A0A0P7H8M7_9EURY|nr:NEW3 domain-containing protein [Halolamina pelagica]KPN29874.1 NPCBM-associated, NEW3 domain of alpha-galactosidase [Halolamina pelagica]